MLEDAQGGNLAINQMRRANIQFAGKNVASKDDSEATCSIVEDFVVANVTNVLISMGRLLKHGWKFSTGNETSQAGKLMSPDGKFEVGVHYRQNSLSVLANIFKVTGKVRGAFVRPLFDVDSLSDGWQFLENGTAVNKRQSKNFVDPRGTFPLQLWKYRTTVVKVGNFWEVVENCRCLTDGHEFEEDVPGILFVTTIVTYVHREPCDIQTCMFLLRDEGTGVSKAEHQYESESRLHDTGHISGGDVFGREPDVPPELHGECALDTGFGDADFVAGGHDEMPNSVVVNGSEISLGSTAKTLRKSCQFLGVSTGGSKQKMFNRIVEFYRNHLQKELDEAAARLNKRLQGPSPSVRPAVKQPTESERKLHQSTHLPFQDWCEICTRAKSREDYSVHATDFDN